MCHPEDGGNTSVRNFGINQYLWTMNDLPSAHNWLDAVMIEIAAVICTLDMAGDHMDLISKKKLTSLSFRPPPPGLIFAYLTFLGFYYGMCRRIVR